MLKNLINSIINADSPKKAVNFQSPDDLSRAFDDFEINDKGINEEEIRSLFEKVIENSVDSSSPRFANQLFGGRDDVALAADFLASYLNLTMATYEMSAVATMMERSLIDVIARKCNFINHSGKFVSGGSYGNIAAMMCARNLYDKNTKSQGVRKRFIAFVSKDAHYCFLKAANMLGIGIDNIIKIDVDENGMCLKDLEEKINYYQDKEDCLPFFINATAGTTVKGNFDNITKISKIAKKHKLWLHVDGAYGGPVIFSKKYSHLINGIDLADSFVIDFHKISGVPLLSSALVLNDREQSLLVDSFGNDSGNYIFHQYEYSNYDQGVFSLQCGRRANAIKAWFALKHLGFAGLEKRINHLFDLAQIAKKEVEKNPRLELIYDVNFLNICFRYLPQNTKSEEELNQFNFNLREKILKKGDFMVNHSIVNNKRFIRLVTVNHLTKSQDIQEFFQEVEKIGSNL